MRMIRRYKLRSLFLVSSATAFILAAGVAYHKSAQRQQRLAHKLAAHGVTVEPIPFSIDPNCGPTGRRTVSFITALLEKYCGPHYAFQLEAVTVESRNPDLQLLGELKDVRCLRGAGLSAEVIEAIAPGRLRYVDASKQRVTRASVRHLAKSKYLQVLVLNDCPVTDDDLSALQSASELVGLHVSRTGINGDFLELLAAGKLRQLSMARCKLKRRSCHQLERFSKLEGITFEGAEIDSLYVLGIGPLPMLRSLNLSNTNISDVALNHFFERFPALEALDTRATAVKSETKEALYVRYRNSSS
jgi:hypothetical protein